MSQLNSHGTISWPYYEEWPITICAFSNPYGGENTLVTSITELPDNYVLELLLDDMMERFSCKGRVVYDCTEDDIELFGDFREWAREFLMVEVGHDEEDIEVNAYVV